MKRSTWLIVALLPVVTTAFAGDLFYDVVPKDDEMIEMPTQGEGAEYLTSDDFDCDSLSLFAESLIEGEHSLVPWAIDEFSGSDVAAIVEKEAKLKVGKKELSSYEETLLGEAVTYGPTLENVPEANRSFFSRPRVVESRPSIAKEEEKEEKAKAPRSSQRIFTNRKSR